MIDMENSCESAGSASAHLNYDHYNREERYLCSHLFRLLHEPKYGYATLRIFIAGVPEITDFRIFVEVALIRDVYHVRRSNPFDCVDSIVRIVAGQEQVADFRNYSELPEELRTPHLTHSRQILQNGSNILTAAVELFRGHCLVSRKKKMFRISLKSGSANQQNPSHHAARSET